MIFLLPIRHVIVGVATVFLVLFVVILLIAQSVTDISAMSSVRSAFIASAVLNSLIYFWIYFGWQWFWSKLPWLNEKFFPNLNGKWKMMISYTWDGREGETQATAQITQSWTSIGIEVEAEDSDSVPRVAMPRKDSMSGRPILFYMYLNTPHAGSSNPATYEGAATLRLGLSDTQKLSGNYFTSRESVGRFELTRL